MDMEGSGLTGNPGLASTQEQCLAALCPGTVPCEVEGNALRLRLRPRDAASAPASPRTLIHAPSLTGDIHAHNDLLVPGAKRSLMTALRN
jgi:hypothetical protein